MGVKIEDPNFGNRFVNSFGKARHIGEQITGSNCAIPFSNAIKATCKKNLIPSSQ